MSRGRGSNPNSKDNLKPHYYIVDAEYLLPLWGPYTRRNASLYLAKAEAFNRSGKNMYYIQKEERGE